MSEYIVTVQKGTLTCCNGIQLLPTPGLYHFWGSSCPKRHTHMNDTAFLLYLEFKKKKKKSTYRPSRFRAFMFKTSVVFL